MAVPCKPRSVEDCIAACEAADRLTWLRVMIDQLTREQDEARRATLYAEARDLLHQVAEDLRAASEDVLDRFGPGAECTVSTARAGLLAYEEALAAAAAATDAKPAWRPHDSGAVH